MSEAPLMDLPARAESGATQSPLMNPRRTEGERRSALRAVGSAPGDERDELLYRRLSERLSFGFHDVRDVAGVRPTPLLIHQVVLQPLLHDLHALVVHRLLSHASGVTPRRLRSGNIEANIR